LQPDEYKTLFEMEDTYWWYVARRKLVAEMLTTVCLRENNRTVVDFGCGTGANERVLSEFGQVLLVDMSLDALRYCRTRDIKRLMASSAEAVGLKSNSIDVATALDLLEHVDNDLAGMREIYRILKPGGILLVTVPAFGFLWSEHDEALHHRRRYTGYELRNKLTVTGFEIVRSTYFITLLFLPIMVMRVWQGIFKKNAYPKTSHVILPGWVNSAITGLLTFERKLCGIVNLPFGVSIVTIARKPR
jgi:SAM-dependent methyltransferase